MWISSNSCDRLCGLLGGHAKSRAITSTTLIGKLGMPIFHIAVSSVPPPLTSMQRSMHDNKTNPTQRLVGPCRQSINLTYRHVQYVKIFTMPSLNKAFLQ